MGDVVIGENMEKGKTQGPVIRVGVILPGGTVRVLEALMDTGAMCNLIREGILSPHMLQATPSPMKLVTVTGETLPRGTHEAKTCLLFHASEYRGLEKLDRHKPFWLRHGSTWTSFWIPMDAENGVFG